MTAPVRIDLINTPVRVVNLQSSTPVRILPMGGDVIKVDFIARGPRGKEGDKGDKGDKGDPGEMLWTSTNW